MNIGCTLRYRALSASSDFRFPASLVVCFSTTNCGLLKEALLSDEGQKEREVRSEEEGSEVRN